MLRKQKYELKHARDSKDINFPEKYNKNRFYDDLAYFLAVDPSLKEKYELQKDTTRNGEKIKDSVVRKQKTSSVCDDERSKQSSDESIVEADDNFIIGLAKIKGRKNIGSDFE